MRLLLLFVSALSYGHALAATSDILVFQNPGWLYQGKQPEVHGAPGNVIFNGDDFVTPTVQTNGEIYFTLLDANGFPSSHPSVAATGSSPRLAFDGSNYLIAWFNTNVAPTLLVCSRLTNGVVSSISTLATNALPETILLRASAGSFLAVWQSSESNSAVFARSISGDGLPAANAFAISPSSAPQRYPALNMEGTNYLVCWMEQNFGSNDWRVMARRINETGPLGPAITVSQTNSLTPHPTACAFGTNFLVAWSADEGPYSVCDYGMYSATPAGECPEGTNLWFAMVYGRMVTPDGNPVGNTLGIIRARGANTNVVLAFGGGQYWAESLNGSPRPLGFNSFGVQFLRTDGTRVQGGFHSWWNLQLPHRIGFGGGRFCVLYPWSAGSAAVQLFGRETIALPKTSPRAK